MSSTFQYLVSLNSPMRRARELYGRVVLQAALWLNAIPVAQMPWLTVCVAGWPLNPCRPNKIRRN